MEQVIKKNTTDPPSELEHYKKRLSDLHASYEVESEEGTAADMEILIIHFGLLCRSALDRLNHGVDGFVISIQHNGRRFRVFRKLLHENYKDYPELWLLKSA